MHKTKGGGICVISMKNNRRKAMIEAVTSNDRKGTGDVTNRISKSDNRLAATPSGKHFQWVEWSA